MDYSSQILKKTRASMIYMNGYRLLRFELKSLFYLVLMVLLLSLWQAFFHDNIFRLDVWLYILIAVFVAPLLYCFLRPVKLLTVVRLLDVQLKLQQRLETFFENLEKRDEVISLQRKDTFDSLKSVNMSVAIKFRWPFEARIIPFIIFFIFLLFAGKGLFGTDRAFVTGLDLVKEVDIKYQIAKNPFKKNNQDEFGKVKESRRRINTAKSRKLYKTSAGDTVGLTELKIPKNDQIQSKLDRAESESMIKLNTQKDKGFMGSSQTNKNKINISSKSKTKRLRGHVDKADSDRMRNHDISELSTKTNRAGSALTGTDVINAKNILNNSAEEGSPTLINDISVANGSGSAGAGDGPSVNKDAVKSSEYLPYIFVGDRNYIEEMISRNSVQPSLREYVKKYFLSLSDKSAVSK